MKLKQLLFLTLFLAAIQQMKAQVIINGTTFPILGAGTSSPFDTGINYYGFDAAVGLFGGDVYLFRRDNYWYMAQRGIGVMESVNVYLSLRTVLPYPTNFPPDCAQWQSYGTSPGVLWSGYPTSSPTAPAGSVQNLSITGSTVSAGPGTSTATFPEYIDLSTKSTNDILSFSNNPGRLLYNMCDNAIQYNDGLAWKSVWPNKLNYPINLNQALEFGNTNTQIVGRNPMSLFNQIAFKTDNKDRLVLEKDNTSNFSTINLKSSFSVPYVLKTTNYTISEDDHIVVFQGTTAQTFTLPAPSSTRGRLLIIVNTTSLNLNLSHNVIGLGTVLSPGQRASILSINTDWLKVN
ncbi:hypothetical protein EGI26_21060 [Lacihabitans sp. CCS-44]|uniref:hypothetical protein n=1 Tax=Lacihabitans sp. CCS-44 TaxID=2487331 RepID=UPI0020CD788A|nr:hypothetical protein [Lacihabitans sp. CCS-44]MCP9757661.1 hypothetical protein [Lacihabitans sp. CCS-44]